MLQIAEKCFASWVVANFAVTTNVDQQEDYLESSWAMDSLHSQKWREFKRSAAKYRGQIKRGPVLKTEHWQPVDPGVGQ